MTWHCVGAKVSGLAVKQGSPVSMIWNGTMQDDGTPGRGACVVESTIGVPTGGAMQAWLGGGSLLGP